MGVILLSIILMHAGTANFNESFVSCFKQTNEPRDDNESLSEMSDGIWPRISDSGRMKSFPFGFLGQANQSDVSIFNKNNSAVTHNNQTGQLVVSHELVLFFKGFMFTRFMPSFYIFVMLVSLPLNSLAVVTFTRIRVNNSAGVFMSPLACVDLLFTLLLPLKIHYQVNGADWVFGEVACRVLTAAYYCNMYCSILLMMCISVDRLLAVAFPVTSLTWRSARKASCVCVLVWLLALAGVAPLLGVTHTFSIQNLGVTCFDFLDIDGAQSLCFDVFLILHSIYFFLPLIVTLVSYSAIIYVLCTKHNHLATSSSCSDNRRRAVIMVTAVLIEFVVCFGPTSGIMLYDWVNVAMNNNEVNCYPAYLLAMCLGSASIFLDPLLYYYGSSEYRQKIHSVFWGWKAKRANLPSNSTQTQNTPIHELHCITNK